MNLLLVILLGVVIGLIAWSVSLFNEIDVRDSKIKALNELRQTDKLEHDRLFALAAQLEQRCRELASGRSPKNHVPQAKYDALQKQYDELHINVEQLRSHIIRLRKSKGIK
jgi:tetrahydromethanopterin S-methyltransferase subunit G